MKTRIQILQDAILSDDTFTPTDGLTIRKIGLQEEALLSDLNIDILTPAKLAAVVNEELATKNISKETEDIARRLVFICSSNPEEMRKLIRAGKESFEDAYFSWLGTIKMEDLVPAIVWIFKSIIEISAALFSVEDSGDESKNAPIPAERPT